MKNYAHSIFSKSTQQQDVCNHIPKIKQKINVIYFFTNSIETQTKH